MIDENNSETQLTHYQKYRPQMIKYHYEKYHNDDEYRKKHNTYMNNYMKNWYTIDPDFKAQKNKRDLDRYYRNKALKQQQLV